MTPEEWQRVRPVLESALELDSAHRTAYLDGVCIDPSLRREVESLIAVHEQAGTGVLNSAAGPAVVFDEEAQFRLLPGKRVGPYEILEETAQGGMGRVYRAIRADGQYKQQVALKIVRADLGAQLTATRFRNERQILASLDHPNIAKILDGGTTADGLPYFVMEYIDGLPITEFCDQHKLTIDARLKIFRTVCSAVHCAHQHLVIHRDLKPCNILVTAEGIPKLLDFGIAKILDPSLLPENVPMTAAGLWMMTPEYASPEQLRGEAVTTATDVYALGLVLYELLTGHRAYHFPSHMPHDIARAVLDTDPQKPSTAIRRTEDAGEENREKAPLTPELVSSLRGDSPERLRKFLAGDLDNIVLKAIRKEPRERYSSADQLSEDIRRYLEHLPVLARKSTVAYRCRKYVQRHKVVVTAAALVLSSLLTGITLTLREARIARANELRAERRFNDVRKLANSLMFDIHDSIRDLPGATQARKLLVSTALEYLDRLSQEASGDPLLQQELAAAYDRIGDVLGYNGAANLGDLPGASETYAKAMAIRETLATANPNDVKRQAELADTYWRLAFVLREVGDFPGALRILKRAHPLMERIAVDTNTPMRQDRVAGTYWLTALVLESSGDFSGALQNYRKAALICEPIATGAAPNPLARTHLAGDYMGIARILGETGHVYEAVAVSAKGLNMIKDLSEGDPTNSTLREYLGEGYNIRAGLLAKKGDLADALILGRQEQKLYKELSDADPSNALARANLGWSDLGIGEVLVRQGHVTEGMRHIRGAIKTFRGTNGSELWLATELGQSYSDLGLAYVALAERKSPPAEKARTWREARSWYEKALDVWTRRPNGSSALDANGRDQVTEIRRQLAMCDANLSKLKASTKDKANRDTHGRSSLLH
jgi:serine/threonine protein kinase